MFKVSNKNNRTTLMIIYPCRHISIDFTELFITTTFKTNLCELIWFSKLVHNVQKPTEDKLMAFPSFFNLFPGAYLAPYQTSIMKLFAKIVKELHHRCLTWSYIYLCVSKTYHRVLFWMSQKFTLPKKLSFFIMKHMLISISLNTWVIIPDNSFKEVFVATILNLAWLCLEPSASQVNNKLMTTIWNIRVFSIVLQLICIPRALNRWLGTKVILLRFVHKNIHSKRLYCQSLYL